jgi:hypothetical protein
MIKKLLTLSLLLVCFFPKAQETQKKVHYIIHNPAVESALKYEKALYHTDLDGLRFLNGRRIIPVEGSFITIELFSANELLKSYGKQISPLTITNSVSPRNIKFKMAENKMSLIVVPDNK